MRDPTQRLSAKDALSHPWLTGSSTYPLTAGATIVTKDTRPVKRKAEPAESGSPCKRKRRQRSDSDNSNLLLESPDCPSALPLGPRDLSIDTLELPPCHIGRDDLTEGVSVNCFVRPEGKLFV